MTTYKRQSTSERKLAAIMFTDIVGYTALMGSDEDRAFELLHKNRKIHTTLIEQHDGTLIKEMGDGMLISFDQASEAVQCAIDIQQRARKELTAKIRIGIHLGDITFEGEDVFGDGVNIA
jgi:adenylate cyclase